MSAINVEASAMWCGGIVTAMTWGIVGLGALLIVAAAYARLVEQEQVHRGADALRFRVFRVWVPLVIGVAAFGKLPRALSAPFPVVVFCDVLSLAPAVFVGVLGLVAARQPRSKVRTTTPPEGEGNTGPSR
ncbi:hypothetical protein [Streptomyces sp. NPDC006012]|uniref:hypothetical protein n=1 Tax=Streptomyces sp. NPDC006012 TaxID=3364739 RepID=UPI003678CB21